MENLLDLTPKKIYNLLLESLGFPESSRGSYAKLEGNDIVSYTDTSYHGSPYYTETYRKTVPEEVANLIRILQRKSLVEAVEKASDVVELGKRKKRCKELEWELTRLKEDIVREEKRLGS